MSKVMLMELVMLMLNLNANCNVKVKVNANGCVMFALTLILMTNNIIDVSGNGSCNMAFWRFFCGRVVPVHAV